MLFLLANKQLTKSFKVDLWQCLCQCIYRVILAINEVDFDLLCLQSMLHKLVFDIQPFRPFVVWILLENGNGIVAVRANADWLHIIQQAELEKDLFQIKGFPYYSIKSNVLGDSASCRHNVLFPWAPRNWRSSIVKDVCFGWFPIFVVVKRRINITY